jgi:hypothetical protein
VYSFLVHVPISRLYCPRLLDYFTSLFWHVEEEVKENTFYLKYLKQVLVFFKLDVKNLACYSGGILMPEAPSTVHYTPA